MVLFLNLCSCFFFLYQASLLKSIPLRLYANFLAFNEGSLGTFFDWTNVSDMLLFSFETYPSCCKHYYHVMCSFVNVILSCQFHDFFWLLIKLIMRFKLILSPLSINFSLFYCFILFLFREKISDVIQIFCGYCKWLTSCFGFECYGCLMFSLWYFFLAWGTKLYSCVYVYCQYFCTS